MRKTNRRSVSSALAIALAAGTVTVVAPSATAAPDGSNVVINEVYGGGGNSNTEYTHDFVELYNPTDHDIDLSGWTIQQCSKADACPHSATLSGTIAAKGFYLVQGGTGGGGTTALPTPDAVEDSLGFSATDAIAYLKQGDTVVDLVGWGAATNFEGKPAPKTDKTTSIQRKELGVDTDNNSADFHVAAPTPQNSGSAGTSTEPSTDPGTDVTTDPAEVTPIAQIQGTGAASPLEGKTVKTRGVVTAVYSEGGRNGFYMQTPGEGKIKGEGDASDAVFVYVGKNAKESDYPARGSYVEVTGTVQEFNTTTQLSNPAVTELDEDFEPVTPVAIDALPDGDEARERYEGMLVKPGTHTVTDNFKFNRYGEMSIVPGEEPLRQPTDVMAPGDDAFKLEEEQRKKIVLLDDAATYNYLDSAQDVPLPYLETSEKRIKSMRVGDQLEFKDSGVIVEYSFNAWRFQPLVPLTGKSPEADLPVSWADTRAAVRDIPKQVEGDYSIASFNVLNYFTTLGETEPDCAAYTDRFGEKVSTNRCTVRGAYSQQAFQDQQAKIVLAINELDSDVVGLMEVENTGTTSGDVAKRDEALSHLVSELNNASSDKDTWAYVKSPAKLGTNEDVIRVAFIYKQKKVEPVGDSIIFDDSAFTGVARQPLAQEFKPAGGNDADSFVAVVNHFKSKGSVAHGDADQHDGQSNNPNLRVSEAQAVLDHLAKQDQWSGKPVFLLGDLNSYSQEDSLKALRGGGFTEIENRHYGKGAGKASQDSSYAYGSHVGSLDHVLANKPAEDLVKDAAVWNINADEPIVFQYSRRNYHGSDLFQADNPFAASDHDPVKVGFTLHGTDQGGEKGPEKDPDNSPETTDREIIKTEVRDDGHLWITYASDPANPVDAGRVLGEKGEPGRGIEKTEINDAGELVITYTDGTSQNLGKVRADDDHKPANPVPGHRFGFGWLGFLLGVLATLAAGIGIVYYLMPDEVNKQLEQWGLR